MAPADFRDYRSELQTFDVPADIPPASIVEPKRTHEFGVRQALGATQGDIMRLVFASGATMTVAGLAAGLTLAFGSSRLLGSLLYNVRPSDPATLAAVAALLAAAACSARCARPSKAGSKLPI